jgi:hypothetical protein
MPIDARSLDSLPRGRPLVTVCSTIGQEEAPDDVQEF